MATIGALVAELHADTAAFHKDMGKAVAALNTHAARMNKSIAGVDKAFGGLAKTVTSIVSAGALVRFVQSQIDLGDQLSKTSQKLGISVEKLSAYQYAAKLSGNSNEELTAGLARLTNTMQDAARNGAGEAAQYFRALGISVTDANGQLRNSGDVFEELSRKFQNAPDGPEKTATAIKLLGRSGANLIPLMNSLSDTTEEARRLGYIVSTDFAKASERFNDEMERMKRSLGTFLATSDKGSGILDALLRVLKAIQWAGMWIAQIFEMVGARMGAMAGAATEITRGEFRSAIRLWQMHVKDIEEMSARGAKARSELFNDAPTGPSAWSGAKKSASSKGAGKPLLSGFRSENFLKLQEDLQRSMADMQSSMITDEAVKAQMRVDIQRKEWRRKIEIFQQGTAERKQLESDFQKWLEVAQAEAAYRSRTPLQVLLDNWRDVTKQMQDATAKWAQGAADALTDFVMTGKLNFKDFANSIIRDLLRIQIQRQLAGILGDSSGGIGGFLSKMPGMVAGARAEGGPVSAGSSYLVGERGPEVFTPRLSGQIIPNSDSGGGIHIGTIDARGADAAAVARLEQMLRNLDATIEHRAIGAVMDARQRGGRFSAVFGG